MKNIHKISVCIIAAALMTIATGCKKYLEEYNPAGRTAETYFNTAQGFEDLVKSNYPNLRGLVNYSSLYSLGTDIFSSYGTTATNDVTPLNIYSNSLNSSIGDVDGYWKQLYYAINIANSTLYWSTLVQGENATTLGYRIGEAKTLRAYYYYLLAETFGDVILVLKPATEPTFGWVRTPEKDIYTQIVTDLTDAIAVLPTTTPDFGRITKGAAQHLLAKIYLTRATKTYGGGAADFTLAGTTAEAVINSGTYSLKPKFSDLFDPTITNFQVNPEVIFSVQYSTTTTTNGAGNTLHQYFLWDTQSIPPIGRSSLYGKPNYVCAPDPYFFSLFDKKRDGRYSATVWNAIIAQTASPSTTPPFAVGDTVIYYPDSAWTPAQKAAVKYTVFNPDEYRKGYLTLPRSFPEFKKFREINLTYGDGLGTRDTYVFRLGETYLIAAEAYLQAGNTAKALQYYNAIRARAAKPGNNPATGVPYSTEMQVTTVSLDDILDERARELAGEEFRWFELKRTGKLISRTLTYNDEAKAANTLKAQFLLRPIPQSQIDLNKTPFPQNPGY
jgi:hypothetical protein